MPETAGTDFPGYGNRPYRVSGTAEVHQFGLRGERDPIGRLREGWEQYGLQH